MQTAVVGGGGRGGWLPRACVQILIFLLHRRIPEAILIPIDRFPHPTVNGTYYITVIDNHYGMPTLVTHRKANSKRFASDVRNIWRAITSN